MTKKLVREKIEKSKKELEEADKETTKKIKKQTGGIIPSIPLGP